MLQIFVGSHYVDSQVSFVCCLHKVGREQNVKRGFQLNIQIPSQLAAEIKIQDVKYTVSAMQLQLAKYAGSNGIFQKNIETEGIEDIRFGGKKSQERWQICYFTLGMSGQNKASPIDIPQYCVTKTCYTPEISILKSKTLVSNKFFLTSEFPLAFQLIPGNSICFFIIPLECPQLNFPVCFFFWNSPMSGTNSQQLSIKTITDYQVSLYTA